MDKIDIFKTVRKILSYPSQRNSYSYVKKFPYISNSKIYQEIEHAIQRGADPDSRNKLGETISDLLVNHLNGTQFKHQIVNGQCSFCQLRNLIRFLQHSKPNLKQSLDYSDYNHTKKLLSYWIKPDESYINKLNATKHFLISQLDFNPGLKFVHHVLNDDLESLQAMKFDYEAVGELKKFEKFVNLTQQFTGQTPLSIACLRLKNIPMIMWLLSNGAKADIKLGIPICNLDSNLSWSPLISRLIYTTFSCPFQLVDKFWEILKILCNHRGINSVRLDARCSTTDKNLTPWLITFLMPEDNFRLKSKIMEIILNRTKDRCLSDRDSEGNTVFEMLHSYEYLHRLNQTKQWLAQYMLSKFRILSLPRAKNEINLETNSIVWYPERKTERHAAQFSLAELALRSLAPQICELVKDQLERVEEVAYHETIQQAVDKYWAKSNILSEISRVRLSDENINNKLSNLGIYIDSKGSSILHKAVKDGDTVKVNVLTKLRPDLLMITDTFDQIPLHYAFKNGNKECIEILNSTKILEQNCARNVWNQLPCQLNPLKS